MLYFLVSDDAFLDLCVLQEKAQAALKGITDSSDRRRIQTLADIAGDYLSAMGDTAQAMQENRIMIPSSPCSP